MQYYFVLSPSPVVASELVGSEVEVVVTCWPPLFARKGWHITLLLPNLPVGNLPANKRSQLAFLAFGWHSARRPFGASVA